MVMVNALAAQKMEAKTRLVWTLFVHSAFSIATLTRFTNRVYPAGELRSRARRTWKNLCSSSSEEK